MVFTEDLSGFFRSADFAVLGTYTPSGGSATPVYGIFDNVFSEDLQVAGSLPVFECSAADIATLSVDDLLTISGTLNAAFDADYFVRTIRPDGTGVSVLTLEKDQS